MAAQEVSDFIEQLNELVNMGESTDQEVIDRSVFEWNNITQKQENILLIMQALVSATSKEKWIGALSRCICKFVKHQLYFDNPYLQEIGKIILQSIMKPSFFTVLIPNIEGEIIIIFRRLRKPLILQQFFNQALKFYLTKKQARYFFVLLKIAILSLDVSVSQPYLDNLKRFLTQSPASTQKISLAMVNCALDNPHNLEYIYPVIPDIFHFLEVFCEEGAAEEYIEFIAIVMQVASKIVCSGANYETKEETRERAVQLSGSIISKCMELYENFAQTSQIILSGLIFAYNAVGFLGTKEFIDFEDFFSFLFTLIANTSKEYTDEEPFQVFTDLYDVSLLVEPSETDFRNVCLAYLKSIAMSGSITNIISALPEPEEDTAEPHMFFIFLLSNQIRRLEDCEEKQSVKETIAEFAAADFSDKPIDSMTQCLLLSSQTDDMTEEMFEDIKSKLREISTCDTDDLGKSVFKYVAVKSIAESTHCGFPIFTDVETVELIRSEEDMNMSSLLFEVLQQLIDISALSAPDVVFQLIIEVGITLLDDYINREKIGAEILSDESNEDDIEEPENSTSNVDIIEIISSFIAHYPQHIDFELFIDFFERVYSDEISGSSYHNQFKEIVSSLFMNENPQNSPLIYEMFERYINTLSMTDDIVLLIYDILSKNNSAFINENDKLLEIINNCFSDIEYEEDFNRCAELLALLIQLHRDNDELIESFYGELSEIDDEFIVLTCNSLISAAMIIAGKNPGDRVEMIVRLIESDYQIGKSEMDIIRNALKILAENDENAQTLLQELESKENQEEE